MGKCSRCKQNQVNFLLSSKQHLKDGNHENKHKCYRKQSTYDHFREFGCTLEKNIKSRLLVGVPLDKKESCKELQKQHEMTINGMQRHSKGAKSARNYQSLTLICFRSFEIIIQFQMSKSIKKLKQAAKEVQSCPVCMSRAVNCQTVECSHQFCYRCLSKWGRRKGNCPLCRTNIRKIHYKKKIIEPEYLKYFDDQSSIVTIPVAQREVRPPTLQPSPPLTLDLGSFIRVYPATPTFYIGIPIIMYPTNNA